MATTFPTYPGTTFEQAVELAIFSSNQLHNIINGDSLSTVDAEDGAIPTVRKALIDNIYFKTPAIEWEDGTEVTVFNQLYTFSGGTTGTALWYAPTASTSNVITMGSSPESDDNWKLYGWDTYSRTELSSTSGASYVGTSDGSTVQSRLDSSLQFIGNYGTSVLTITSLNDIIEYNGNWYYVNPSASIPFTTTGNTATTWDTDESNFVAVGDATLRQELAGSYGLKYIGDKPVTGSSSGVIKNAQQRSVMKAREQLSLLEVMPVADWEGTESRSNSLELGSLSSYIDEWLEYLTDKNVTGIIPGGYYGVSKPIIIPQVNEIIGAGMQATYLVATSDFSGESVIDAYSQGIQGLYRLRDVRIEGGNQSIHGIWLGASRNSEFQRILITGADGGAFRVQSNTGFDIENSLLSKIWTLDSAEFCLKIATGEEGNGGSVTDGTFRDLQLVSKDTGVTQGGIPLLISNDNSKLIFGLKFDRLFNSTVNNKLLDVVNTGKGFIYGNSFNDFTAEMHDSSGNLTQPDITTMRLYSTTGQISSNDFTNMFHSGVQGDGIELSGSGVRYNNISGMRFYDYQTDNNLNNRFLTLVNGATDNLFHNFNMSGIFRNDSGFSLHSSNDFSSKIYEDDATKGRNRFDSIELTSAPVCLVSYSTLSNIQNDYFAEADKTDAYDGLTVTKLGNGDIQIAIAASPNPNRYIKFPVSAQFSRVATMVRYTLSSSGLTVTLVSDGVSTVMAATDSENICAVDSDFRTTSMGTGFVTIQISGSATATGTLVIKDLVASVNGLSAPYGAAITDYKGR